MNYTITKVKISYNLLIRYIKIILINNNFKSIIYICKIFYISINFKGGSERSLTQKICEEDGEGEWWDGGFVMKGVRDRRRELCDWGGERRLEMVGRSLVTEKWGQRILRRQPCGGFFTKAMRKKGKTLCEDRGKKSEMLGGSLVITI